MLAALAGWARTMMRQSDFRASNALVPIDRLGARPDSIPWSLALVNIWTPSSYSLRPQLRLGEFKLDDAFKPFSSRMASGTGHPCSRSLDPGSHVCRLPPSVLAKASPDSASLKRLAAFGVLVVFQSAHRRSSVRTRDSLSQRAVGVNQAITATIKLNMLYSFSITK